MVRLRGPRGRLGSLRAPVRAHLLLAHELVEERRLVQEGPRLLSHGYRTRHLRESARRPRRQARVQPHVEVTELELVAFVRELGRLGRVDREGSVACEHLERLRHLVPDLELLAHHRRQLEGRARVDGGREARHVRRHDDVTIGQQLQRATLHLARADVEDLLTVDRHRKAVEPLVTRLLPLEGRPRQGELLAALARPAEQLRGSTQWDGELQAHAVLLEHRVAVDRHLGWLDGRLGHGRGGHLLGTVLGLLRAVCDVVRVYESRELNVAAAAMVLPRAGEEGLAVLATAAVPLDQVLEPFVVDRARVVERVAAV
mmetsp:Transcript_14277/g.33736  ORF Transcript_14277/g.33736 Transcript_14277/m.33736 type:complete len:315 (-) Transcript_14277:385-1329(-)